MSLVSKSDLGELLAADDSIPGFAASELASGKWVEGIKFSADDLKDFFKPVVAKAEVEASVREARMALSSSPVLAL